MNELSEWIKDIKTIEKSRKDYAHFDLRTDLSRCEDYVLNPQNIATHSFYPFIHYEKKSDKYCKNKEKNSAKEKIPKARDICYASHKDRCVFQLYSHILNDRYNQEIKYRGIDSVPVAYRSDLQINNIGISKKAFDYIRASSPCYVIIGDFTGFFDNLDHGYLKSRWCDLLGVDSLPKDHYTVFKNITQYSQWELSDICEINHLEYNKAGIKKLNSKRTVLTKEQYKKYRPHITKNTKGYGIPQGSPISAVLANLYMIDVDTEVNRIISEMNGLYMRYSDDFILVLPKNDPAFSAVKIKTITDIFNGTKGLQLESKKTQFYYYENNTILNCGKAFDSGLNDSKKTIDFLGFSFNGTKVTIRAKTISKYYYRMYRKAKNIAKNSGYTSKGTKISKRGLYNLYSIKGAYNSRGSKGNFITYVNRAKKCYGSKEDIDISTRNHMQKIRKALNSK